MASIKPKKLSCKIAYNFAAYRQENLPQGDMKWAMGMNDHGGYALGTDGTLHRFGSWGYTPPKSVNIIQAVATTGRVCSLDTDGGLSCSGYTKDDTMPPKPVGGWTQFAMSTGICAIQATDKRIKCWGSWGHGTKCSGDCPQLVSATWCSGPCPATPDLGPAVSVHGGYGDAYCAVMEDQTVKCWRQHQSKGAQLAAGAAAVGKVKLLRMDLHNSPCVVTLTNEIKCWDQTFESVGFKIPNDVSYEGSCAQA